MNNSPRMKLLTLCIGAALAQMASLPALADTAVGVDTVIGNAANPGYASSGPVERDADAPAVQRTPTGQMYLYPPAKEDVAKGQVVGGVDVGVTADSDKTNYAKRKEYSDTRDGLTINNFGLAADTGAARYFSVNGGGVGRTDQFYDVTLGKYNSWKVKAFYTETTHVFTDTYKDFYNGTGTGNLSHGLNMPSFVTSGTYTQGTTANFVGATATCTAALPCLSYNGKVYSNAMAATATTSAGPAAATALAGAVNGTLGTPNATTGLIPIGANPVQSGMALAISNKLNGIGYSELSLVRKKSGMRADVTLSDSVKAYVSYGLENRVGARPFAMNDNNTSVEIAEPISYKTHDILTGLSYNDGLTSANLRASASLFRNDIKQLNVQYALQNTVTALGAIQHATYALAPDNDSFNIKGELSRSLPDLMKGRFTAAASWGSNRQNDQLLMPLSAVQSADLAAAGYTGALPGIANPGYNNATAAGQMNYNNWNGVNGNPLSRQTAGQRIDNKLVSLGLALKPLDELGVKADYRFYESENRGGYMAFNPLTGQFGRGYTAQTGTFETLVAPNGSGGCYGAAAGSACSTTLAALASGGNASVFGLARTTRQANYGLSADYDLNRTRSLNGSVEREDIYRTFRERDKTEENKVKLGYVDRALGDATLRVSYEKDTRRGSNYNYRPYAALGQGVPGLDVATMLAYAGQSHLGATYPAFDFNNLIRMYSYNSRKYDQADRNQNILNTRVNYQAREDLDLGLNLQTKRVAYTESVYGLKNDHQDSIGVDMNYQPSFETAVTAFYNYQKGQKDMLMNSGIANIAATITCSATNFGTYGYACADTIDGINGPRPNSARWASHTTDYNNVLGLGLQNDLGFARLGVDYTFARSSTHIAYNYGTQAFNANTTANAAMQVLAGNALPDMTTVQNTITLNLVKPLDKKTTIRGMYRFEGFRVKDWHYDGVIHNAMAAYDGGTLLLDSGAMNYHVNTIGVFLNYKL